MRFLSHLKLKRQSLQKDWPVRTHSRVGKGKHALSSFLSSFYFWRGEMPIKTFMHPMLAIVLFLSHFIDEEELPLWLKAFSGQGFIYSVSKVNPLGSCNGKLQTPVVALWLSHAQESKETLALSIIMTMALPCHLHHHNLYVVIWR